MSTRDLAPIRHLSSLLTLLDQQGDAESVVAMDRNEVRRVSAAELARQACQLACGLRERDLVLGERVALIAESSSALIAATLGIVAGGYVAVPLDVQMEESVLGKVINDCDPKLLLTTEQRAARLAAAAGDRANRIYLLDQEDNHRERPHWSELFSKQAGDSNGVSGEQDSQMNRKGDGDVGGWNDIAVLFYTSGTTGEPKGVPLTHGNLLTQLQAIADAKLTQVDDRVLLPLPLHHVYPLVIGVLAPLWLKLPIILPRSLTGPDILKALHDGEATFLIGVPRLYQALYEAILSQAEGAVGRRGRAGVARLIDVSAWLRKRTSWGLGNVLFRPLHRRVGPKLRVLASGGSPLDPELGRRLEGLGWKVAIGYGLTETSPLLTIHPPGARRLDTVGQPIEQVELRIDQQWRRHSSNAREQADNDSEASRRDAEGHEGDAQGEGEILARGPSIFQGYWNLPEKTEEAFTKDGWFRTGDLGFLDQDNWLHVTGRVSTLIMTDQGEKVQPDEIESVYAEADAIREIGVLQLDKRLVGLVVPETTGTGDGQQLEQRVREAVKGVHQQLPSFKQISDVTLTRKALPRTRIGKIRRHQLEARWREAKQGESIAAGPMPRDEMSAEDRALLDSPSASELWELLADQFSDQPLTPDSNLQLDLGIDSMRWLNLTMQILQKTGVELDDEDLRAVDSVRDLLQAVARSSEGENQKDIFEDPEGVLNAHQRGRLRPLGPVGSFVSARGFGLNRRMARWFFKLQVEGFDRLPKAGPLVIIANHLSHLDPFVLSSSLDAPRLEQTYWAAWVGATRRNPVTRLASRLAKTIPIDRKRGVLSSLAFGAAVLKHDHILVWFPEGQRSQNGELGPFQPGIGMLLQRCRVPVVPVAIRGTYEALPPGKRLPRRHPVQIRYGEPLDPNDLEREGQGDQPNERIVDALHQAVKQLMQESKAATVPSR